MRMVLYLIGRAAGVRRIFFKVRHGMCPLRAGYGKRPGNHAGRCEQPKGSMPDVREEELVRRVRCAGPDKERQDE